LFENSKEAVARAWRVEEWQTVIARVSNKMQVMRTISTMQAGRHDNPMVSAVSYPPLQKSQERGTRSLGSANIKIEDEWVGHPPAQSKHPYPVTTSAPVATRLRIFVLDYFGESTMLNAFPYFPFLG
jgi:hypothetical protein